MSLLVSTSLSLFLDSLRLSVTLFHYKHAFYIALHASPRGLIGVGSLWKELDMHADNLIAR